MSCVQYDTGNPVTLELTSAYLDVFGRPPNAEEVAGWTRDLARKQWSPAALRHWMMDWLVSAAGDEERGNVIARAYKATGLTPHDTDFVYWTREMRRRPSGNDPENHMFSDLVNYLGRHKEIQAQITYAYAEAFGRVPNAAELEGWTKDIASRKKGVEQHALVHWLMDWLRSPAGATEEPEVITRAYQQTFGRVARPDEIDYWKSEIYNKRPGESGNREAHTFALLTKYLRNQGDSSNTSSTAAGLTGGGGSGQCAAGFVWREAAVADHVCVTPETRSATAADNARAESRRNTTGTGDPGGCMRGFVWREALVGDYVCVAPEVRASAAEDNRHQAERRADR
jgi:hypothetical protein